MAEWNEDSAWKAGLSNDPRSVVHHIERVATHETQHLLDSRQGMTFDRHDVPYRDRLQEIRARKAEERIRLDPDARKHTLLNDDMREDAKGGESADDLADFISELPPDDDLGDFIFENKL